MEKSKANSFLDLIFKNFSKTLILISFIAAVLIFLSYYTNPGKITIAGKEYGVDFVQKDYELLTEQIKIQKELIAELKIKNEKYEKIIKRQRERVEIDTPIIESSYKIKQIETLQEDVVQKRNSLDSEK